MKDVMIVGQMIALIVLTIIAGVHFAFTGRVDSISLMGFACAGVAIYIAYLDARAKDMTSGEKA